MARWGGIYENTPGRRNVTTVGSGPTDGWVQVARLPNAAMGITFPQRMAFVVTGKVGFTTWSGTSPVNGLAQIALGDTSGFKHPDFRHEISLLVHPNTPWGGTPFTFIVILDQTPGFNVVDPLWGGNWNGAEDLVIWARSYRNGDPANYAPDFVISDVRFLWFDLESIPAGAYFVEEFKPSTPATLGNLGTFANLWASTGVPGAVDELWMHLFAGDYRPKTTAGPPWFQHGYVEGGSFSNFVPKVGTVRWGNGRRAGTHQPTLQNTKHWQGGMFHLVQPSGVGFAPAVRGQDRHNVPSLATELVWYRWLAIRLDDLPEAAVLEPGTSNVGADNGTLASFVPWEPGLTSRTFPSVFMSCVPRNEPGALNRYDWFVRTNEERLLWQGFLHGETRGSNEGTQTLAMFSRGLGPSRNPNEVQYQGHVWQDPITAPRGIVDHPVDDIYLVQAHLDDDPSHVPALPLLPGNPIVLVPQREALDVSSLAAIPNTPDAVIAETDSAPFERIKGATGYPRQWPAFTGPRRVFRLQFTGLRKTAADALLDFFKANPAHKWTPPRDSAQIASVVTERARMAAAPGNLYVVSVQVTELVWLGAGP